jgi:hypothetical protein
MTPQCALLFIICVTALACKKLMYHCGRHVCQMFVLVFGCRSPRGSSGAPPSPHGPHSRPLTPTTIADWDLLLEANRERMMKRIDDVTNLLKLPPAGRPWRSLFQVDA